MVALGSLLACVLSGLVPATEAFAGFGHPAVVTVACVLVLSQGLLTTGAVDALAYRVLPTSAGSTVTIAAITGLGTLLSAFLNNVGAMALLMPVAVQIAARRELAPGKVLMPLAFGTILGGMTTLIGTPPNLVVSGFRAEAGQGSFGMFDFSPVGLAVAFVGVAFVAFFGWRLVPTRKKADTTTFDTGTYFTEARVTEDGKASGMTLRELEAALEEADAQVIGMTRSQFHVSAPNPGRVLQPGDILVIEAEPASLASVLTGLGLKLEEDVKRKPETKGDDAAQGNPPGQAAGPAQGAESTDTELLELVVMPDSALIGRTASEIRLRDRYSLNLLALSRQGRRSITRLRSTAVQAGDVLLMQGAPEALSGFSAGFGCVPLAARPIHIPDKRRAVLAMAVMTVAIACAAFGLIPAAIAFGAGVLAFMVLGIVPPRRVYEAVDWPVVVLLAALIPVAGAIATTGTADLVARWLLDSAARGSPVGALAIVLIVTMTLSDFMNNTATAAVMCPIAIGVALRLGVNPDTFLMAVAIGASCAFLTPVGHQNNTLILGPGGFRFGDYWRLGLPLEILVVAVGMPMLLFVWPL